MSQPVKRHCRYNISDVTDALYLQANWTQKDRKQRNRLLSGANLLVEYSHQLCEVVGDMVHYFCNFENIVSVDVIFRRQICNIYWHFNYTPDSRKRPISPNWPFCFYGINLEVFSTLCYGKKEQKCIQVCTNCRKSLNLKLEISMPRKLWEKAVVVENLGKVSADGCSF